MSASNVDVDRPNSAAGDLKASSHRGLFWLGVLFAATMIPIFIGQVFLAKALITPWYLPIGGTIGALAALASLRAGRRWWQIGIALVCVALAGFEWFFVTAGTMLPQYNGPVVVGSAIPAFHAKLADGTLIDESYFKRNHPTALIFYQGRWCPFCMTQLTELNAHHADFERLDADVVVVSIEDLETAAATQRDFPHLKVVSDEGRKLAQAVDVINPGFGPEGTDSAAPTNLLLDGSGTVRWFHRPTRFIARPSAMELATRVEQLRPGENNEADAPAP